MKPVLLFGVGALIVFAAQQFFFLFSIHYAAIQQSSSTDVACMVAGSGVAALILAVAAALSFFISVRCFQRQHALLPAFAFGCACALVGCCLAMGLRPLLLLLPAPALVAAYVVVVCIVSAFIPVAFVARSRGDDALRR